MWGTEIFLSYYESNTTLFCVFTRLLIQTSLHVLANDFCVIRQTCIQNGKLKCEICSDTEWILWWIHKTEWYRVRTLLAEDGLCLTDHFTWQQVLLPLNYMHKAQEDAPHTHTHTHMHARMLRFLEKLQLQGYCSIYGMFYLVDSFSHLTYGEAA